MNEPIKNNSELIQDNQTALLEENNNKNIKSKIKSKFCKNKDIGNIFFLLSKKDMHIFLSKI